MDDYTIIFNYFKGNREYHFSGTATLNQVMTRFEQDENKNNNHPHTFTYLIKGQQYSKDSYKTLLEFSMINKKLVFLVIDNDTLTTKAESPLDKINNNQFKERNWRDIQKDMKDVLKDMAIYGYYSYKEMQKKKDFYEINEIIGIKDEEKELFILGILSKYLGDLGITAKIEKTSKIINKKEESLSNAILQFVFNGLLMKKKYYLYFKLKTDRIKQLMLSRELEDKLRNIFINAYKIKNEEIIITKLYYELNFVVLVIFKNQDIKLTKDQLIQHFQFDNDLKTFESIKKQNIIESIILNKSMLDKEGYRPDGTYGHYEKRGGEDYLPPDGWDRYGLNVEKKYDNQNDDWLAFDNRPGEWCIAYGWFSYKNEQHILSDKYENDIDIKQEDESNVGKGIYCCQNPEIMESHTESIIMDGERYKLGLMLRVNPTKIRCPANARYYWVVDGFSNEIRPYGILFKKLDDEMMID